MKYKLFIPDHNTKISDDNIWRWYTNIFNELNDEYLSDDKEYLINYYLDAGLLRYWRRSFFRYHYSRTFTHAVQHLFQLKKDPHIIDLGCGTGTQTIMLSLLGAKVTGIDIDEKALSILNKRKSFYEKLSGRILDIKVFSSSAFDFDYGSIAPIQGIYSMFAFNLMKPSRSLIEKLVPHLSEDCSLAILDGNNISWLAKIFPNRRREECLTPFEMEGLLYEYGFDILHHDAGFVIPPICWFLLPGSILRPIDRFLGKSWYLAISHQILARRHDSKASEESS